MATILFIDDEEPLRMLCQTALEGAGYRVLTTESGPHGLRLLQYQEVDLILVDIFMPEMDGLDLIPRLRATRPTSKIIAMSGGSWEWDYLDSAKQLGRRTRSRSRSVCKSCWKRCHLNCNENTPCPSRLSDHGQTRPLRRES